MRLCCKHLFNVWTFINERFRMRGFHLFITRFCLAISLCFLFACSKPSWQNLDVATAVSLLETNKLKDSLVSIDPLGVIYNTDTVWFQDEIVSGRDEYILSAINPFWDFSQAQHVQSYSRSRDGNYGMFVMNFNSSLSCSEGYIVKIRDTNEEDSMMFFFQDSSSYVFPQQLKAIDERHFLFSTFSGREDFLSELLRD